MFCFECMNDFEGEGYKKEWCSKECYEKTEKEGIMPEVESIQRFVSKEE